MAKTVVEGCLSLGVDWMNKKRILFEGANGSIRWSGGSVIGYSVFSRFGCGSLVLRLDYSVNGQPESQEIPIVWSELTTGGKRPWFRCVVSKRGQPCGRRVGKLYLPPGGRLFACRHCYELAYTSQQTWTSPRIKALFGSIKLMAELERRESGGKLSDRDSLRLLKKQNRLLKHARKAGLIDDDNQR